MAEAPAEPGLPAVAASEERLWLAGHPADERRMGRARSWRASAKDRSRLATDDLSHAPRRDVADCCVDLAPRWPAPAQGTRLPDCFRVDRPAVARLPRRSIHHELAGGGDGGGGKGPGHRRHSCRAECECAGTRARPGGRRGRLQRNRVPALEPDGVTLPRRVPMFEIRPPHPAGRGSVLYRRLLQFASHFYALHPGDTRGPRSDHELPRPARPCRDGAHFRRHRRARLGADMARGATGGEAWATGDRPASLHPWQCEPGDCGSRCRCIPEHSAACIAVVWIALRWWREGAGSAPLVVAAGKSTRRLAGQARGNP